MAEAKSRPPPRQNLSKYLLFCAAVCHSHQVSSASDTNHRQPRQHLLLPSLLPLPPPPLPATTMTLLFRSPATAGLFGSSNTATSMALLPPFHHPIMTFPGRHYKLINIGLQWGTNFFSLSYIQLTTTAAVLHLPIHNLEIYFILESSETIQNCNAMQQSAPLSN